MSTSINIDITINDPLLVCRGCLASCGEMKNMIEWSLVEDFYKLTTIQINKSDELSELLCTNCEDVITKYRYFSAQCLQSDLILRNFKKKATTEANENTVEENSVSCTINNNIVTISITAPNMETKIYLPCPYCSEKFQKKSDLLNHLHKRHNNDLTVDIRFYCTYEKCVYNMVNDKYFTGRKYLNQHIFKVHKNKLISCSNCSLSFFNESDYHRHVTSCNFIYECQICNKEYKSNERLLVHLLRNHPELHKQYKSERKAEKRKQKVITNNKKTKIDTDTDICDSPKRSFATQTLLENIKNDVTLSWEPDKCGTKKDEISTQTVFEDSSSIKSQNEEDSIFFSETVSLSDIQTQTIPLEFGLSRSNKETITSHTQSPDLSIKETQTCLCLSKPFKCDNLFNTFCMTSTETQTLDFDNDLMSFNSTETQTCSDDMNRNL